MPEDSSRTSSITKERILDTAERVFADHGFAGSSLRKITREAGVNLAAANYHFGSKEGLIQSVMARRIGPLNRERLALLDRLLADAGSEAPSVEQIVEVFLAPALRMKHELGESGESFMRLMGHAMNQPSDRLRELIVSQFTEIVRRFSGAFALALPRLSAEEIVWRLVFSVGSLTHALVMSKHIPTVSEGLLDPSDVEAMTRRMVRFVSAGFQAPATEPGATEAS